MKIADLLALCREHANRADDCGRLARAVLETLNAQPIAPDALAQALTRADSHGIDARAQARAQSRSGVSMGGAMAPPRRRR